MIIWLNGTFGVGKTSTADRLASLIPNGRVFDPETVGVMLRANLADRPVPDFQDWAAWPPLVAATLIEISRMTGQNVIAPQTVLKRERLEQMLEPLRAADVEVFHVLLDADEAVLRSRIEGADATMAWRLDHLNEYRAARSWMVQMADLVVDTVASTPPQIARRILVGLPDLGGKPAGKGDSVRKPDSSGKADSPAKADSAAKADSSASAASPDGAVKAEASAKEASPKGDGPAKADAAEPNGSAQRESALADK